MGFWRTHYFVGRRGLESSAQTEVFDLPKVGIISNLLLKLEAKPGSENNDIYLADILTKVEVIGNGSTVIKSYDGRQIQAIQAYDDGVFAPDVEISPSGWARGHFDIRFGRFQGDEKYALDCGAWQSLELKITYDLAAGGVINTTGFTSTGEYISVFGRYSPVGGGVSPAGYIKSEEKRTLTTTANTEVVLDLPSDYPYRRLIPFCETHGYSMSQAFQYVTIDINEGAKKAYDNYKGADMIQEQALRYKQAFRYSKRIWMDNTGSMTIHRPFGWKQGCNVNKFVGAAPADCMIQGLDPSVITFGIVTGITYQHLETYGFCPWGSLLFDLEKDSGGKDGAEAMRSAWDCSQADDITFKFTPSSSSLAISIVLEQYVAT